MRKDRIKISLCILLFVLAIVAGLIIWKTLRPIEVDNQTPAEEIITIYYSDLLLNTVSGFVANETMYRDVYVKDIRKLYDLNIECKRSSPSGVYYVLASEGGTKAFIFVDECNKIENVMVLEYTVSYDDILSLTEHWGNYLYNYDIILGSEMMHGGNNYISVCYASPGGVVLVNYGLSTLIGSGSKVESVEYIDDNTLQSLSTSDCWYGKYMILPIDKEGLPVWNGNT